MRLDAVTRLQPGAHGDGVLVLHDGEAVPLSRTYRAQFLRRFDNREDPG